MLDTRLTQRLEIGFPEGAGAANAEGYFLDNIRMVKERKRLVETLVTGFEPTALPAVEWRIDDSWPENDPGKTVAGVLTRMTFHWTPDGLAGGHEAGRR